MGVRGLKTYLERNNGLINRIKIEDEVEFWEKKHPNQQPIVCIDFMCLSSIFKDQAASIYGGRHQQLLNKIEAFLKQFQALDVRLVFFSDANVQTGKIDTWLNRRNESFKEFTQVYDDIESGKTVNEVVKHLEDEFQSGAQTLSSAHEGLFSLAKEFGEFYFAFANECDFELARYATEHQCMAIISNDTGCIQRSLKAHGSFGRLRISIRKIFEQLNMIDLILCENGDYRRNNYHYSQHLWETISLAKSMMSSHNFIEVYLVANINLIKSPIIYARNQKCSLK